MSKNAGGNGCHHIDDEEFDGLKHSVGGVFVEEGIEATPVEEGKGDVVKEGEECRKDRLVNSFGESQPIEIDWDKEPANNQRTVGYSGRIIMR